MANNLFTVLGVVKHRESFIRMFVKKISDETYHILDVEIESIDVDEYHSDYNVYTNLSDATIDDISNVSYFPEKEIIFDYGYADEYISGLYRVINAGDEYYPRDEIEFDDDAVVYDHSLFSKFESMSYDDTIDMAEIEQIVKKMPKEYLYYYRKFYARSEDDIDSRLSLLLL